MISSDVIKENIRAWETLSLCCKNGITLHEAFQVIEEECSLVNIKTKFRELILKIQDAQGAPPPEDWNSDTFLPSTKHLAALGWTIGLLDATMPKAVDFLKIYEISKEVKEMSFKKPLFYYCFAVYFQQGMQVFKVFDLLESELNFSEFQVVIKEWKTDLQEGKSLTDAMKKNPNLCEEYFVKAVSEFEEKGDSESLTQILENEEVKNFKEKIENYTLNSASKEKSRFYSQILEDMKKETPLNKSILKSVEDHLSDEELKQEWLRLVKLMEGDFQKFIDEMRASSLPLKEKTLLIAGIQAGTLDQVFLDLSQL